jgi:hypothetical protein
VFDEQSAFCMSAKLCLSKRSMPGKLRTLDLFTGIGGVTRALSDMIEVVAY